MVKDCWTCKHHLGGGSCRMNSEKECAENEFELWEPFYEKVPICHGDCGAATREDALRILEPNIYRDGKLITTI